MDAAKDGRRSGPTGPLDFDANYGVGKSIVYRILDPEEKENVGLDMLSRLAQPYDLPAWCLLHPDFKHLDAQVEAEVRRRLRKELRKVSPMIGALLASEEEGGSDGTPLRKPGPANQATKGEPPETETTKGRRRR